MRVARIACTDAGTWMVRGSCVSRYAPRSPTSAVVSTSVRTLSSRARIVVAVIDLSHGRAVIRRAEVTDRSKVETSRSCRRGPGGRHGDVEQDVGDRPDQLEVAPPLADDLVAGGEGDDGLERGAHAHEAPSGTKRWIASAIDMSLGG